MRNIQYKNIPLQYKLYGDPKNPAIVLLHGYLESLKIWKNFVPLLENDFFIICPDLPGHGKSGVFSTTHSMEELAESVKDILLNLGIKKVHMAGHSLGGYVVLAFADHFDDYLNSFVLFHSSCHPDTEEKKENRNREIDLFAEGKKNVIVNTNIPMAFADDNKEEFSDELERAKIIAAATEVKGAIAILNGMKLRPGRCHLFKENKLPSMLIAGKKDNYIPFETSQKMIDPDTNAVFVVLENSGHMGFIEEREKAAGILRDFFIKYN